MEEARRVKRRSAVGWSHHGLALVVSAVGKEEEVEEVVVVVVDGVMGEGMCWMMKVGPRVAGEYP